MMLFSSSICSYAPILCTKRDLYSILNSICLFIYSQIMGPMQTHGRYVYAENPTSTCSSGSTLLYPKRLDILQPLFVAFLCYVKLMKI